MEEKWPLHYAAKNSGVSVACSLPKMPPPPPLPHQKPTPASAGDASTSDQVLDIRGGSGGVSSISGLAAAVAGLCVENPVLVLDGYLQRMKEGCLRAGIPAKDGMFKAHWCPGLNKRGQFEDKVRAVCVEQGPGCSVPRLTCHHAPDSHWWRMNLQHDHLFLCLPMCLLAGLGGATGSHADVHNCIL